MNARRACVLVCFLLFIPQLASAQRDQWVATWAASPQPSGPDTKDPVLNIDNQTVRERVRVSIGGAQIRLRLSNEYGSTPLQVGAVTVAVPTDASSVQPGSIRKVTFSGHNSVAIPAGAPALSDPVAFPIASGAEVTATHWACRASLTLCCCKVSMTSVFPERKSANNCLPIPLTRRVWKS